MSSYRTRASHRRKVSVGVSLPQGGDIVAEASIADELGFDYLSCGEHVFFHGSSMNSFVALAAAAGATRKVRIVNSVALLPLYPPALLAKMAASLSLVSNGRYELGVGVGGEFPDEFWACGVPPGERGRRADEGLEIVRQLLDGETVDFKGDFSTLNELCLDPVPGYSVPIWVGGRRTPAMERAARHGDVWMPYMVTPERFGESLERVREKAVEFGRHPLDLTGAIFMWGSVADDGQLATEKGIEMLSQTYDQDFRPLADRYLVSGTPEDVASRLRQYNVAGAERMIFVPATTDSSRRVEMYHQVAESVLPLLE